MTQTGTDTLAPPPSNPSTRERERGHFFEHSLELDRFYRGHFLQCVFRHIAHSSDDRQHDLDHVHAGNPAAGHHILLDGGGEEFGGSQQFADVVLHHHNDRTDLLRFDAVPCFRHAIFWWEDRRVWKPPFISGGTTRNVPIPSGSCSAPSSAQAYSLNITVVPHTTLDT